MFLSQFESKELRRAHMLEKIDQLEFESYKRRERAKEDLQKLKRISEDLRTEQG